MIYALLSQNFVVEIYALFPQNILDWGADSANFFAFWMYALGGYLNPTTSTTTWGPSLVPLQVSAALHASLMPFYLSKETFKF